MVLRKALTLVAIGLVLGGAGAWMLGSTAEAFLFQLEPTDVGIFGVAVAVLVFSAIAASIVPASRAATVDPTTALRQE